MQVQVSTKSTFHAPSRMQQVENRVFSALYNRSLLYNTCWEDPAVDRQALDLGSDDRVVVITSAGCNVLDYALEQPARIHAIDANPRQTALLELKLAAIRTQSYGTFFELFGLGRCASFRRHYARSLRGLLSTAAQEHWDRRQHWFDPTDTGVGFYYRGLSGLVARAFRYYMRARPRLHKGLMALVATTSLEEQRAVYHRDVAPFLFSKPMLWMLDRQLTMNLLGVPASQRLEVQRGVGGGVSDYVKLAVHRICTELPFASNYFWMVYLRGSYTPGCAPRYLEPEGFAALKGGLVDRISPETSTLTEFLRTRSAGELSRFVLLDHMDWMAWHDPRGLEDEWQQILRTATSRATIIFRSGAAAPTYLQQVAVETPQGRKPLDDMLLYDLEKAARLHREDRVGTYAGFHIAYLR